jgi:hypothetical protein
VNPAVNPPANPPVNPSVNSTANPVANPPVAAARTEPSAPAGGETAAPSNAIAPPTRPPDRRPVEPTQPEEGDTRVDLAASPAASQPVLAQQDPYSEAPVYLMAAVALLLVALLMAWLYIRSIRYVPGPSIISQSIDRQKK